jgi:hypothetical protein
VSDFNFQNAAQNVDDNIFRFADGYYKLNADFERPPANPPPELKTRIDDFLPIICDSFSDEEPRDDDLASKFLSDLVYIEAQSRTRPPTRLRKTARQSGVIGVNWNDSQKRWVVTWYEGGRRRFNLFPVAKFGEAEALRLAISKRKEIEASGTASLRVAPKSGHAGVHWKETQKSWYVSSLINGKMRKKYFSVNLHGGEQALRLAVAWKAEHSNISE